jgi:hypothetical protein
MPSFGGTGNDQGQGIAVDASGSIYNSGVYLGTLTVTTGVFLTSNSNSLDIYVIKLDASGSPLWATR